MGPLPTLFYPAFHVMDYGVHTWDMRWGLGEKDRKLDERTAGDDGQSRYNVTVTSPNFYKERNSYHG
jgi:hypothetical protein